MILAVAISMIVPAVIVLTRLGIRAKLPGSLGDMRGIALQTVIIMVVLLAIAGSVAAVLLTRGGEAVDDLDESSIGPDAAEYTNSRLCERAGHSWNASNICVTT